MVILWKGEGFRDEAFSLQKSVLAILVADVEGYNRLMLATKKRRWRRSPSRLVDKLIALHRVRIENTAGDSVLAEFASVLDAVSCAVGASKAE